MIFLIPKLIQIQISLIKLIFIRNINYFNVNLFIWIYLIKNNFLVFVIRKVSFYNLRELVLFFCSYYYLWFLKSNIRSIYKTNSQSGFFLKFINFRGLILFQNFKLHGLLFKDRFLPELFLVIFLRSQF
jgi:hypothetical protein